MPSRYTSTINIDPSDPLFFHLNQAMDEISRKQNKNTMHVLPAIAADIRRRRLNIEISDVLHQAYQRGLQKIAQGEIIHNPIAWIREESRYIIKSWTEN